MPRKRYPHYHRVRKTDPETLKVMFADVRTTLWNHAMKAARHEELHNWHEPPPNHPDAVPPDDYDPETSLPYSYVGKVDIPVNPVTLPDVDLANSILPADNTRFYLTKDPLEDVFYLVPLLQKPAFDAWLTQTTPAPVPGFASTVNPEHLSRLTFEKWRF